MKKVRVIKEMPFAKVGEEVKLNKCKQATFQGVVHTQATVRKLVGKGYLEYVTKPKVEEPRTLEEKFHKYFLGKAVITDLAKLAKEHYLEVFDKFLEHNHHAKFMFKYGEYLKNIRKALEEA